MTIFFKKALNGTYEKMKHQFSHKNVSLSVFSSILSNPHPKQTAIYSITAYPHSRE